MANNKDSVHPLPASKPEKWPIRELWWRFMDYRVGYVPAPILLILVVLIFGFAQSNALPSQLSPMIALLGVGSCICYELGQRLPILRSIGGPVILAMFLPSFLVFEGIIPPAIVQPVSAFWKATNFMYLFIPCIIVGSVLSMDRTVLIRGFMRLFVPLGIGSVVAGAAGTAVGVMLGLDVFHTIFFVVIPVMAGGLGEGVIPLTIGYASIMGEPQGELLAKTLPAVMLGNVTAIVCAGLLNTWGKKRPDLTGYGALMRSDDELVNDNSPQSDKNAAFDIKNIAAAGMVAVCLYCIGMFVEHASGLPGPVVMLSLAVAGKLAFAFSPSVESGAGTVYKFFATVISYPLLFAIGIVVTPWQQIVDSFNMATIATIVTVVVTMMAVGGYVGRKVNMHFIDAAIVVGTHSGMGGHRGRSDSYRIEPHGIDAFRANCHPHWWRSDHLDRPYRAVADLVRENGPV